MIVRNHTPFVPEAFSGANVDCDIFGVLALRGTFRIVPFQPLSPDVEQSPLAKTDTFHGAVARSSLLAEGDFAPFKPRSDICVDATAQAPGGLATPRWDVRVQVGRLEKTLRVCGPRHWVKGGGTYHLTEPEAVCSVPLRYELAFGGIWGGGWGKAEVCEENPVGVGFVPEGADPGTDVLPAPQIEAPEDPISEVGKRHRPEGVGPIFRAWLPRRALAGRYDDEWRASRWPALPTDFDCRFYNCAHPALTFPGYLKGDEEVTLEGVDGRGPLCFSLPSYTLGALIERKNGSKTAVPLMLDTLHIDVPRRRAYLTWRAVFRKGLEGITVIGIHMKPNSGVRCG